MAFRHAQAIHQLPPRFRPTIIVVVGKAGMDIYNQAARLFAGLDEPLRPSVVTLAHILPNAIRRLPLVIDGSGAFSAQSVVADQTDTTAEMDITEAIHQAIRTVQDSYSLEQIKRSGYEIPSPRTQVIIVSAANDSSLETVTNQVCAALRSFPAEIGAEDYLRFDTLVTYVLTSFGSGHLTWARQLLPSQRTSTVGGSGGSFDDAAAYATQTPLAALDPGASGKYPPEEGYSALYGSPQQEQRRANVSFAFLYSLARDYDYMLPEKVVYYVMAEALFALTATGMTEADTFRRVVVNQAAAPIAGIDLSQEEEQRKGSLGVCMVRYPRASAEIYWIDRLAAETITRWAAHAEAERPGDATNRQATQQREAATFVQGTLQPWFLDPTSTPARAGRRWPHPQTLTLETNTALAGLKQARSNIQRQLDYNTVLRERQKRAALTQHPPLWSESAQQAFSSAQDSYRRLQESALAAWRCVQQETHSQIEHMIDDLWLGANTSWLEAHAFAEELDKELGKLLIVLSDQRVDRDITYRNRLNSYARLAQDVPAENVAVAGGDFQTIRPQYGASSQPNTLPPAAGVSGTPAATDPSGRGVAPLDAEESLSRRLVRRADLLAQRLPSIPTLIATALAAFPAAFLLLQANLAPSLGSAPAEVAISGLGVGLSLTGLAALHKLRQARAVERARKDSLNMRRDMLQERYFQRRNQLGVGSVMLVRRDVQDMRALLADWPKRLRDIAQELSEEATTEETALFTGAIGRQDVLVANGTDMDNFSVVYIAAQEQRIRKPRAPWHRDYDAISDQLRQELRQRRLGVIGLGPDTFKQRVREFLHGHFVQYLHEDSIAAIHQAIDEDTNVDARRLWERVQERAAPLRDMAGNNEDYASGVPDDLTAVQALGVAPTTTFLPTRPSDRTRQWLLVAKLRHR